MTEGQVTVRHPVDGAPAAKAGVRAGDVVTEIDDAPLKGLDVNQVLAKLRGTAGTQVRLRVARQGQAEPIDFKIVREVIRQRGAQIEVRVANGELAITAMGPWSVLDFEKGKSVPVEATSSSEFRVDGGDHTRITFIKDPAGQVSGLVLNPGAWEIKAAKIN